MKNNYQSKAVPRGTRTIWRYFSALFLFFALGITQMWAADPEVVTYTFTNTSCLANQTYTSYGTPSSETFGYASSIPVVDTNGKNALTLTGAIYNNNNSNGRYIKYDSGKGIALERPGAIYFTLPKAATSITINIKSKAAGFGAAGEAYNAVTTSNLLTCSGDELGAAGSSGGTFTANNVPAGNYKIYSKQALSGSSSWGIVSIVITYPASSGPVDPEFTYTPATYTIGDEALDLSAKLTSTNTIGAISFAVSASDAGTTGASIANGKDFTATDAGTATITVTQEASDGFNAKSEDIEVTVVASGGSDTEAPEFVYLDPEEDQDDAPVSGNFVLTMSENVSIKDASKFSLAPSDNPDAGVTLGTPTVDGAVITIPYSGLENDKDYTFTAAAGAVEDGAGNENEHFYYSFVTVAAAPAPTCDGTLFSWLPKTGLSDADIAAGTHDLPGSWLTSVSGGTAQMYVPSAGNMRIRGSQLAYNSGNAYIHVIMDCELADGDIIDINSSGNKNKIWLSLTSSRPSSASNAAAEITQGTSFVLSSTNGASLIGEKEFYVWRNSSTTQIGQFTISRPYSVSYANLKEAIHTMPAKAVEFTLEELTNALFDHTGWTADKLVKVGGNDKTAGTVLGKTDKVTLTDNTTFTAVWEEKVTKYTVAYYDGEAIEANKLGEELVNEGGNPTGAGLAPKKQGFTFGGWSTTNGGAAVVLNTISVEADMPLFVVWTAVDCPASGNVFSFEMNNDAKPSGDVKAPVKEELVIDEYLTINGSGSVIIGNTTNNNNQYSKVTSTPNVNLSGATGYLRLAMDCQLAAGDVITIAKNNTQIYISDEVGTSGPTGNKYTTASNSENTIVVGANETTAAWVGTRNLYFWYKGGGVNITAISVSRPYTVSFNLNGQSATAIDDQKVVAGGKVTEPDPAPEVEGQEFGGWFTDAACSEGKEWVFATATVSQDTILYAKWTALPKMTLKAGEGATGDDIVSYPTVGEHVAVPTCPVTFEKSGYVFAGWVYSPSVDVENGLFIMPNEDLTLTAQWVDANNVAQIGEVKYATFAEAAAAVADGETIQLLQDCDYDAIWNINGKTVTLDLNGKNLTYAGAARGIEVQADAKLILMDGTATVAPTIDLAANPMSVDAITYTSGTFDSNDGMRVIAGGEIVFNSGRYIAKECVVFTKYTGKVTVNNGVLICTNNAVLSGNGTVGYGGYTITVNGGILYGQDPYVNAEDASMAIYHPNTGTVTVTGGTLVSEAGPGIVVRAGTCNITGGTIVAKGTVAGKCGDANAPLIAGVGVAYDFNVNYPGADIAATITGGTISGEVAAAQAIYAGATPSAAEKAAVAISGGSFNTPVAEALCADGYVPETKANGKYGVIVPAQSIDFEAIIDTYGTDATAIAELDAQLAAKHYDIDGTLNDDRLDNPDGKPYDKGFKVKKTGLTISFSVEAGKVVEITTGSMSGASIKVDAEDAVAMTASHTHTYYSDDAQAFLITMTAASNKYNIFKSIVIRNPYQVAFNANGGNPVAPQYAKPSVTLPSAVNGTKSLVGWFDAATGGTKVGDEGDAFTPTKDTTLFAQWEDISTDARLASITLDPSTGVLSPAFDPEVTVYTYTMPYGTAAIPQITGATAVNAGGSYNIVSQADAWGETAIIRGVAASSDTKAYNITMLQGPKDGICMIWGNVTDNAMTRDADKSKYDGTLVNDNVRANAVTYEGKTGPKFQKPGYLSLALDGQSFKAGDVVEAFVTQINGADKLRIFNANEAKEANVIAEGDIALGVSRVALPVDAATIYLRRGDNEAGESYKDWNPCVAYVAVYRISNPILNKVTVAGVEGAPVGNVVEIEVPASTADAALEAIAFDWISNDDAWTADHAPVVANAWAFGVENTVTFTDKDGDESVYYITISQAEPSSDATLASLTVNGQAIALADGVYSYDFELPYGTSVVPTVVATAHHIAAVATVTDCDINSATIEVVPESGDNNKATYTINFVISKWAEVVIWDGSYMTAVAESPDATGLAWELHDFGSIANYNTTCGEKSYTKVLPSAGAATGRYMTLTVPAGYVAKFYVVMASHSDGTERGMFIGSNLVKNPDETSVLALSNNDRDVAVAGMSEIVGAGTYYINPNASIDFQEIRAYVRPGYARTEMLGNGVFGTVCVPNNVAVEDIHGVTVCELAGREPQYGKIVFDEIVGGQMDAGKPYVFIARGDRMVLFYGETHVDEPDNSGAMQGTFEYTELTELNDVYYFANRALWGCADLTVLKVPANRAYVLLSHVDYLPSQNANPAPGRLRMIMDVHGEEVPAVTTGMDALNASEAPVKVMIDGKLFILRGEQMFDATGRLVK